jgi:hypothetical protein
MSKDFMESLKNEASEDNKRKLAVTENGAVGFDNSGKALLDLNFKTASYRSKSDNELIADFTKAFMEDKNLAVKWLFFARDAREGIGERSLFRKLFAHLINTNKSSNIEALLKAIPEYGRWDDIFVAFDSQYEDLMVSIVKNQFDKDIENMQAGKQVSLLAKWMPRENTSNRKRVFNARKLIQKFGLKEKQYRKSLSELNNYLKTLEVNLSSNKWDVVDYEKVPSLANLKYKNAFLKHDETRRKEFLTKLSKGEVKLNMSVGFPHDIVHAYAQEYTGYHFQRFKVDEALEGAWKNLPSFTLNNTIVVGDSSGSMNFLIGNTNVKAIEVAHALGIYCGDHGVGPFKNKMITFSETPQFLSWKDSDTLAQKLNIAFSHSEIANTNIQAVFQLILKTAVKNHCKQDEIPGTILIISDMEFDEAIDSDNHRDRTLFQHIELEYKREGYILPRLCFLNVSSRTNVIPIQENESGVILMSGFSPNLIKMLYSGKTDPYEILIETLNSDRYKEIIWE